MTRIQYQGKEINPAKELRAGQQQTEQQALKKIRQNKRPPRRPPARIGCCSIFLLLFFALFLVGAILIAKTGIIKIPIISRFIPEPAPTRVIDPLDKKIPLPDLLSIDPYQGTVKITITEQELTALMAESLKQDSAALINSVQAVITPEKIELFGKISKPIFTSITVDSKPILAAGNLNLKLFNFKIGNLSLPTAFIEQLVQSLLKAPLQELNNSVSENMILSEIELSDGFLQLRGKIKSAL